MTVVKTAVSVPEHLFQRLDALAKATNTSRSQLFAEAVEEYLRRHQAREVTEALNRVYSGAPDPEEQKYVAGMLRLHGEALEDEEW